MNIPHEQLEAYCEAHSSGAATLQQALIDHTEANHAGAGMLTGAFQGVLLTLISRSIRPQRILEIGTYTGFSALCLAEGLTPDGKLTTFEIDEKLKPTHDQYVARSARANQIDIVYGDVNALLPAMDEKFDLVYIDATKKDYPALLDLCLEKLAPGGSILIDNVLWKGKVLPDYSGETDRNAEILKKFNTEVGNNEKLLSIMLPIRDGLYWIMKK